MVSGNNLKPTQAPENRDRAIPFKPKYKTS